MDDPKIIVQSHERSRASVAERGWMAGRTDGVGRGVEPAKCSSPGLLETDARQTLWGYQVAADKDIVLKLPTYLEEPTAHRS